MEENIKEKTAEQNKEDFPEARKFLNNRIKKISFIIIVFLLGSFVVLVLTRVPRAIEKQKTEEAIAKIHATKLTMADVMGENLPPDPGEAADDTIEGIDANQNGIRDDVELAIFKEYPHSAKIRAALLQYALALQTQMTLDIVNTATVTASVENNESRAQVCLWSLSSRSDMNKFLADIDRYEKFIKNEQIDTEARQTYLANFYSNLKSFGLAKEGCDLEPAYLSN